MPVTKTCIHCGNEFQVPPCRAKTAKTCSKRCKHATHPKTRSVVKYCLNCGEGIVLPKCHADRGNGKYCSKECQRAHWRTPEKVQQRRGWMSGEKNPSWKGGVSTHSDGYVYRHAPDHPYSSNGYVLEHRLVIEKRMRKETPRHRWIENGFLPLEILVHHRDEDRSNNDPGNLMAITPSAHIRWHRSGKKPDKTECWPHVHPGVR
jgi:hypothetical protein